MGGNGPGNIRGHSSAEERTCRQAQVSQASSPQIFLFLFSISKFPQQNSRSLAGKEAGLVLPKEDGFYLKVLRAGDFTVEGGMEVIKSYFRYGMDPLCNVYNLWFFFKSRLFLLILGLSLIHI